MEHRIWSNLHRCFWVTVTQWLQNKLSHVPFTMRTMVFVLSDRVTCEVPKKRSTFHQRNCLNGSQAPGVLSLTGWLVSSVWSSLGFVDSLSVCSELVNRPRFETSLFACFHSICFKVSALSACLKAFLSNLWFGLLALGTLKTF